MNQIREFMPIAGIREQERSGRRRAGYLKRCLELGERDTHPIHGEILRFDPKAWLMLREEFRQKGVGDVVHKFAGPVGRALGVPCLQKGTTNLIPGKPCANLRDRLNAIPVPEFVDRALHLSP